MANQQKIERPNQQKDKWDKLDIILKPTSSVLAAVIIVVIGNMWSGYLEKKQLIESRTKLYAELMSKREEADSSLRKDMLNSILNTFLNPSYLRKNPKDNEGGRQIESDDKKKVLDMIGQKVLALELLGYNFHNAIDLTPLFKDVDKEIGEEFNKNSIRKEQLYSLESRLEHLAKEVKIKQISSLESAGEKLDGSIFISEFANNPGGFRVIDNERLPAKEKNDRGRQSELSERIFSVHALYSDYKKKEVRVKLEIVTSYEGTAIEKIEKVFWVGLFDFPMIDNTRLPNGDRCTIVLRDFKPNVAEITLIYFPGSRASLKQKPFYDEVIDQVLKKGS